MRLGKWFGVPVKLKSALLLSYTDAVILFLVLTGSKLLSLILVEVRNIFYVSHFKTHRHGFKVVLFKLEYLQFLQYMVPC